MSYRCLLDVAFVFLVLNLFYWHWAGAEAGEEAGTRAGVEREAGERVGERERVAIHVE